MRGALFLAGLAGIPLIGYPFTRLRVFAGLTRAARCGLACALGALVLCLEMLLTSALHVRWSIGLLLLPSLAAAAVLALRRVRAAPEPESQGGTPVPALAALVAILGVVVYAAATARATASDFVLFWGAKGQRFGRVGAIDVAFLRDPLHALMHPDYPPLVPCLYAWGTLLAGRFAWGAALLSLPLVLAFAALTFYGFAQVRLGRRLAAEYACLLAALLGLLAVWKLLAGDAEPELFLFEVLALSALLFGGGSRSSLAAAGVGLAGAVLTKVEGTVFAALLAASYVVLVAAGRRRRAAAALVLPPAAALGGWLLFCRSHGLLDIYRVEGRGRLSLEHLPLILRELARYVLSGPGLAAWILIGALVLVRRPSRESLAALAVAGGFLVFMVYMYATAPNDPTLWIQWSAARLSMSALLCGFFAVAAADPATR